MATFSVADLTAKSKKTMSKNDKKVIEKYKITSAYEAKKTPKKKKDEKINKEENLKEKEEEIIVAKSERENAEGNIEQSEKSIQLETNPAREEEVSKELENESDKVSNINEELSLEEENNALIEAVIEPIIEEISISNIEKEENKGKIAEEKEEIENSPINIEETTDNEENILPEIIESKEETQAEASDNTIKNTIDSVENNISYSNYTMDDITYDVVDNSYVEQEMKEIMQTNVSDLQKVNENAQIMETNDNAILSEFVNLTKKEENLAESGNENNLESKEVHETSLQQNKELESQKEENISEINLHNDISEVKDSIDNTNNTYEEVVVNTNDSDITKNPESNHISLVETTTESQEIPETNSNIIDSNEEDEDDDNTFMYGEADPNQFVYYHRKDIRLKFHTGEKRRQLLESIKANGIHEPILVRQGPNTKFEIIAGHNRQDIAKELGIKVPYILLQNVDDDTADQICVDTNLLNRQHNDMLPSELSNMLAVKRKMFTLERLSEEFHIANTTMKSFLKLQDLLPELLYDWVDTKKIGMTVGYTIACADRKQQHDLLNYLKEYNIKSISVKQGKEFSNRGKLPWDLEFLNKVFNNEIDFTNVKPQTKVSMTFKELGRYMDTAELKDPKKTLYNMLTLRKKADTMLAAYNMEYSDDILLDALKQYIENNNSY